MWKNMPIALLVFVVSLLSVLSLPRGGGQAQKDSKRQWPKELDVAVSAYRSEKLRMLVIGEIAALNEGTSAKKEEAAKFLLDLHVEEITRWALSEANGGNEAAISELKKQKLCLADAWPIGAALIGRAPTLPEFGGEILAIKRGAIRALAREFCRAVNQKDTDRLGFERPQVIEWTIRVIDRAIQDSKTDKKRSLELERLKIQVREWKDSK